MESECVSQKRWFRVTVYRAHFGINKSFVANAYMFETDIVSALLKYNNMPGVKKMRRNKPLTKRRVMGYTPDIAPLSEKESKDIEKLIIEEGRLSLDEAKAKWYYPDDQMFNMKHRQQVF